MMSAITYAFGVVSALVILVIVIEMLRRRRLRERHAVWWILAGTLALIAGVFPQTLVWAAEFLGVEVPTNLVFFVSIAVLFLVCLQHSAEVTRLESQTRQLAERLALVQMQVRQMQVRQTRIGRDELQPPDD